MCTNSEYAIFCYPSFGPSFGADITIMSDSNSNQRSYTHFGNTYKHADYQYGTEKAKLVEMKNGMISSMVTLLSCFKLTEKKGKKKEWIVNLTGQG